MNTCIHDKKQAGHLLPIFIQLEAYYVVSRTHPLHQRMGILRTTITGQMLDEDMSFRNFFSGRVLWDESMGSASAAWCRNHPEGLLVGLVGSGRAANLGRPRMARLDSWKALSTCLDCALYSYYVCDSTDDIRVVAIGYYPISRSSSESDSRRRRDGGSDGGGDGGYDH